MDKNGGENCANEKKKVNKSASPRQMNSKHRTLVPISTEKNEFGDLDTERNI